MLIRVIAMSLMWFYLNTTYAADILVINSYHNDFSWSQGCIRGLTKTIDVQHKLTYFEMDTKRIPAKQFQAKAEKAWQFFAKMQPDLVITMDDNALKFLGERIANTGTPVVFMGVNHKPANYFSDKRVPDNVSGILERRLIRPSLKTIIEVLGLTPRKILLMMDNGATSQAIVNNLFSGDRTFQYRNTTTLDMYLTSDFAKWKHKVKHAKQEGYAAIIVTTMHIMRDVNGKHVNWKTTLSWTAQNSVLPVFSMGKSSTGKDYALGGVVISSHHQGEEAANKANAILAGAKKVGISIPSKYEFLYSRSGLARWGLTLPKKIARRARLVD